MITLKNILATMALTFMPLCSAQICAKTVVPLQVNYEDPIYGQGEPQRGPVIPLVSIDYYTLTFSTPCYGYTLELVDGNDVVAYTTIITSDTLVLPSTLSGEYQLRLIPNDGNIYFYGYVVF